MKKAVFAASVAAFALATSASAHTTSLGYVPGTNPGEVTFWTGSYQHGGNIPVNEGTFTLTGVDVVFNQVTGPNIAPTNVKPTGLTDGTNNFYWANPFGSGAYGLPSDPGIAGGVVWWQGITFSGLAAGTYDFTCGTTCGTSQQWESWNNQGDGTVRLTLTGRDIGGAVPEPSTWAMMLLGFFGVGFGMRRNRRKIASTRVSYA